ncbi:glycoside hydrolase family 3 C-terminal domain-containing protein [Actinoplanes sp. Pm04-4]|uniref:beta-glucosidase n=1 Tax=Paractinoplanes pyxinae TaxID=2997416 RepID=A0ABT4AU73_9ACTN|nr:glycoside hydrolase family 3 N-terminal domain-containing protein [Actinoplanes pyxinae]MCY1136935.1 glycoside hydrolase family 3 C-terminal domain-containing protein [Actinoplanes pyxinae]
MRSLGSAALVGALGLSVIAVPALFIPAQATAALPNTAAPARAAALPTAGSVALAQADAAASVRAAAVLPYLDPSLPVADRVADLLGRMTLDDKVGQMTQSERGTTTAADVTSYRVGSVLSGGGSAPSPNTPAGWADMYDSYQRGALATPLQIPIIYGIDAVHGNNNVPGSTIFPHNIGLGATRDPALVERIGRATAEEVSGAGQDWTFAPCLCVARNDRWGRTYESYGEKPELATAMTTIVDGLQDNGVLATAKHYIGDGGTTGGVDQGNTEISEAELRNVHLPPFKAAIERGVGSVMLSFSSFNGTKLHSHKYLVTDLLKGELGFTGFVVSDWAAIDQLDGQRGFTQAEVVIAFNAGLDMAMVPTDWKVFVGYLKAAVQAGQIPMARVDDANRRILTKKFELGLFEKPYADRSFASTIGSAEHRALARQAVRQSQVLLKKGILPLAKTGGKIFVAGKSADDLGNQSGGWTLSWQGASGNTVPGTSILSGIRTAVGSGATVTYNRDGTGIDSSYRAAIAVVGETPYAEGEGDRPGAMTLDATDLATLSRLRASGVPVIVVLVSGRPLDIAAELSSWNALIAAWLPGTEGAGVADVLFGDYAPTGKLPVTWMQSAAQQPINDGDGKTPLFPYGYGLTYADTSPDTTAPTVPGVPVAASVTSSGLTLSWTPSADTGGSGLAGYDVYRDGVLIGSPTTATHTVTGLTPATRYEFTVAARDTAGNRSTRSAALAVTTAAGTPSGSCRVRYTTNDWSTGFTGTVALTNTGTTPINPWTLSWTFGAGQTVTQAWSARVTQSGSTVTATGESWSAALAPGATVSFGFNGAHSGANPRPTVFTLNGTTCTTD